MIITQEREDAVYRFLMKKSLGQLKEKKAVILGGQPGAGKTNLQRYYEQKLNGIVINGDEYRKYHPDYIRLQKEYGKDAVYHTAAFSGSMTERMIQRLSNECYNLVIEGTLRKKEVPLTTCRKLKEKGYQVGLSIVAVKPEVSYESTMLRYESMIESGQVARMTPKEIHDEAANHIPDNISEIYQAGVFDRIEIRNRENQLLYDQTATPDRDPGKVMREVLFGKWSEEELQEWYSILERTEELKKKHQSPDEEEYRKYVERTKENIIKKQLKMAGYQATGPLVEKVKRLNDKDRRPHSIREIRDEFKELQETANVFVEAEKQELGHKIAQKSPPILER